MNARIRCPTPAMIVATLALVIAMSGSAFAIAETQGGDSLIAKRTLSGNRLRANTVTGEEVADLGWHNLVLLSGWHNYNPTGVRPPAWAVDAQGIVHLRGAIKHNSGTASTFARLPLSIRPVVALHFATILCNEGLGSVDIGADGYMTVLATIDPGDAQCFTGLDGITWPK